MLERRNIIVVEIVIIVVVVVVVVVVSCPLRVFSSYFVSLSSLIVIAIE